MPRTPNTRFSPAPGRVAALRLAGGTGIRVDAGVTEGDEIAPEFDSMIAKVSPGAVTGRGARPGCSAALAQSIVVVDGGTTNKAFLVALLGRPEVRAGSYDNQWLDRLTAAGEHLPPQHPVALAGRRRRGVRRRPGRRPGELLRGRSPWPPGPAR